MKRQRKIDNKSSEYPLDLRNIYHPPESLYIKGLPLDSLQPRVAIVGSRKCTAYGRAIAESLARDLAAMGIVIVSGLAKGIDAAAHRGALKSGRTISVLGCGFDFIYPQENKSLYQAIPKQGAIVTEFPNDTAPLAQNFPGRNRIISGLSLGVIVVEAASKSGALITADFALEQNKEVMAVPGHIKSPNSKGCHELIKAGAALVSTADDVLDNLGLEPAESKNELDAKLSPRELSLLKEIEFEPRHIDKLAQESGEAVSAIAGVMLQLEIKGYVKKEIGGRIIRIK